VALAVGATGGVAGAVYVMGKLQEELNHPISMVHDATLQGLRDLDLPISEDKADKLAAHVEAKLADDTHVWVDLDSLGDARTKLTIRVGVAGDESRSRKILDAIKRHLS
jgi:RNase adaptor protein for sRNA GlmZ degradation